MWNLLCGTGAEHMMSLVQVMSGNSSSLVFYVWQQKKIKQDIVDDLKEIPDSCLLSAPSKYEPRPSALFYSLLFYSICLCVNSSKT